jgi:hypothetical protein
MQPTRYDQPDGLTPRCWCSPSTCTRSAALVMGWWQAAQRMARSTCSSVSSIESGAGATFGAAASG